MFKKKNTPRGKVGGNAFDDTNENIVYGGTPLSKNVKAKDFGELKDVPVVAPIKDASVDFVNGIKYVFITNIVWTALHFIGFVILIIWRWFTNKIILVDLVTIFSIFNSQPTNYPNQFFPIAWSIGSYQLDIPFLVVFFAGFVGGVIRIASMWNSGSLISVDDAIVKTKLTFLSKKNSGGYEVQEFDSKFKPAYFDDKTYEETEFKDFYIRQIIFGDFWFRWIEWFFTGGALLWVILTTVAMADIFLIVTVIMAFTALLTLGGAHETINSVKLSNVLLNVPLVTEKKRGEMELLINRRGKKIYAFAIGILMNAWIWVMIFVYFGYAYTFESVASAFQWFRWTAPIIAGTFYFLLIPATMIIWTYAPSTYYKSIREKPIDRTENKLNPSSYEADTELITAENTKTKFWELSERLQNKVTSYTFYQDWNKNVYYEIAMLSLCGLCKHAVIWVLWIGMLTQ
jgi:hypothetical protein